MLKLASEFVPGFRVNGCLPAVLGSILLTIVPQYLREFQQYAMLLYGVMLVVVFMYLPGGLVGLIRSNEKS